MTWYLSVGARHIQSWLAATPRLRLMRGASLALEHHTAGGVVQAWLTGAGGTGEVEPAYDEAGEVAGVVVLRAPSPEPLRDISPRLLRHLDAELPGLHWAAWLREDDTYVGAYAAQEAYESRWDGDPAESVRSIPALREHGFLQACPGCGREPAAVPQAGPTAGSIDEDDADEDAPRYGTGCRVRYDAGARRTDGTAVEWRRGLRDLGRLAKDFEQLATRGGMEAGRGARAVGRGESRSHLALVMADGNRFGAFFEQLAKAGPGYGEFRASASRLINERIRDCVVQAGGTVAAPAEMTERVMPLEVHYVGGDDVLVTVPALLAWRFVDSLTEGFGRLRDEMAQQAPQRPASWGSEPVAAAIASVSLGVGLVFARRAYPFGQGWEIAHRALREAKRRTDGLKSAVCFADLTVDGSGGERHLVHADQLHAELEAPEAAPALLRLNSSCRARLSQILRDGRRQEATEVRLRLERERNRLRIVEPLLDDVAGDTDDRILERIEALLLRARWWPEQAQTLGRG